MPPDAAHGAAAAEPDRSALSARRGAGVPTVKEFTEIPLGKGEVRRQTSQPEGKRVAILAFGTMVAPSLAAAEARRNRREHALREADRCGARARTRRDA